MKGRGDYPPDWGTIAQATKTAAGWHCIRCARPHDRKNWTILTVHHWDGDKANCRWWNCLALCQRCHLHIQGKVSAERPWVFEHSDWFKPYVAGFYAFKYLGQHLSQEETMDRLDELLALEPMVVIGKGPIAVEAR